MAELRVPGDRVPSPGQGSRAVLELGRQRRRSSPKGQNNALFHSMWGRATKLPRNAESPWFAYYIFGCNDVE